MDECGKLLHGIIYILNYNDGIEKSNRLPVK